MLVLPFIVLKVYQKPILHNDLNQVVTLLLEEVKKRKRFKEQAYKAIWKIAGFLF